MNTLTCLCRWFRWGIFLLGGLAQAGTLTVAVSHTFDGRPLQLGSHTLTNAAGNRISVTRLDYLLSDFQLVSTNGRVVLLTHPFAYVSAGNERDRFSLADAPQGEFSALRFRVGVRPEINHGDPAQWAPDHPLHPSLNGLHWSWQGGYVFLALEGNWRQPDGQPGGYSYHLATDRLPLWIDLPVSLHLTEHAALELELDVGQIFSNPQVVRITQESSSTHSRAGDLQADQLAANVRHAFRVRSFRATAATLPPAPHTSAIDMAPTAQPYHLKISRFFPQPTLPLDNPLTEEGVELGRQLFNDPALSVNSRQSCASCHQAESAFTDSRRTSLGAEGQVGTRNAMPLFNLAWKTSFFWDGRSPSLRDQVLRPIQDPAEMHEALDHVVAKLETTTPYPMGFARAFRTPQITADRIARALEQFLLTRISHHSKFDRSLSGKAQLSDQEKRGFELFHTEYDPRRGQFGADCFHCHGGPLFQSQGFANNGLDLKFTDLGRAQVTGRTNDVGKFAVPSLRNVALTAPYMHDGRFHTLEEVINHYSTGLQRSATLDPNLAKHPAGGVPLTPADRQALIAFLKTLTDDP